MSDSESLLTGKQRAFVEHYIACGFNATEAARRAGYSKATATEQASRLLTNVNIKAEISRRFAEIAMPADEVLARLGAQARGSMGDFLRVDEEEVTLSWSLVRVPMHDDGEPDTTGARLSIAMADEVKPTDLVLRTEIVTRAVARLDLLAAGEAGKLHLVKKYSLDKDGKVSIELYDAQAALTTIAKHHGLLLERQEVSGPGGGPIPVREVVIEVPDESMDRD